MLTARKAMGKHKLRTRCFLDIKINGEKAGRIVLELFNDLCPKAAENFKKLCQGACGLGLKTGKPLHYESSVIHRIIKGFMIQGGDFSNRDGTGGESIYGGTFADECLTTPHDQPFLLSMANRGPNTNGSQFFITTAPASHLDGKHMVFGHVLSGEDVVNKIESVPISDTKTHRPVKAVVIESCGELVPIKKKKLTSDSERERKLKKKKTKKDKKKKRSQRKDDTAIESSDEVVCSVRPEEVPDVPQPKFLYRGSLENQNLEAKNKEDKSPGRMAAVGREFMRPYDYADRSGRKVKGRGRLRYRSPDPRDGDRERSFTPPHWRQASKNTQRLDSESWRMWNERRVAMQSNAIRGEFQNTRDSKGSHNRESKSPTEIVANTRNRSPSGSGSSVDASKTSIQMQKRSPSIEEIILAPTKLHTSRRSTSNQSEQSCSSTDSDSTATSCDKKSSVTKKKTISPIHDSSLRQYPKQMDSPDLQHPVSMLNGHSLEDSFSKIESPLKQHIVSSSFRQTKSSFGANISPSQRYRSNTKDDVLPSRSQVSPPSRYQVTQTIPTSKSLASPMIRKSRSPISADAHQSSKSVHEELSTAKDNISVNRPLASDFQLKGRASNPSRSRSTSQSSSSSARSESASPDSSSISRQQRNQPRSPPEHLVQKWRIRRERLIQKCHGLPSSSSAHRTPSNDRLHTGMGSSNRESRRNVRSRSHSYSPPRRRRNRSSTSHSRSGSPNEKKGRHVVGLEKLQSNNSNLVKSRSSSPAESPVKEEIPPISITQSAVHAPSTASLKAPVKHTNIPMAAAEDPQIDESIEVSRWERSPLHQTTTDNSSTSGWTTSRWQEAPDTVKAALAAVSNAVQKSESSKPTELPHPKQSTSPTTSSVDTMSGIPDRKPQQLVHTDSPTPAPTVQHASKSSVVLKTKKPRRRQRSTSSSSTDSSSSSSRSSVSRSSRNRNRGVRRRSISPFPQRMRRDDLSDSRSRGRSSYRDRYSPKRRSRYSRSRSFSTRRSTFRGSAYSSNRGRRRSLSRSQSRSSPDSRSRSSYYASSRRRRGKRSCKRPSYRRSSSSCNGSSSGS